MHYTYWNYQVRWYHFIVPALILAFFLYTILNGTGVISLTPDGVLQKLCTDLQTGQMQDAYNQFSSDYQQSHTPADFLQLWSHRDFSTCGSSALCVL